ncbi:hypothetical protein SISNIDRAFT_404495 [Sistotremastrum niveocremeum HHB9708]|uniref:CBD9-like protein n=1 Tax=Sistotremastrum niveocremeum HHB9708 TaxID=1314777 RepID=A0A165A8N5_9AGAM|nr:hypothetical protein SISNIDRAFT_404495 [Sistotremastrum niveocremeum HHB9708]
MCISAIVNSNSTVTYVLQSTGVSSLGWLAIGFGSQMANTPMVIMWPNSDGSTTLSQRQASAEVMPTVVASPPRVATKVASLTALSSTMPQLAFSVPANSDSTQNLIWAFSSTPPDSSSVSAVLQKHLLSGVVQLNLKANSASFNPAQSGPSGTSGGAAGGSGSSSGTVKLPLLLYQKYVVAHAAIATFGFIVLLPTGALIARWLRTTNINWFMGHWVVQLAIAGPVIGLGLALGVLSVIESGAPHLNDPHKKLGVALLALYVAQCSLGAFIHFIKNPERKRRPAQNYAHAILGLTIIALALYQVWIGFRTEWPLNTGRDPVPHAATTAWIVWTVVLAVAYFGGLILLKKQFERERIAQFNRIHGTPPMGVYRTIPVDQ